MVEENIRNFDWLDLTFGNALKMSLLFEHDKQTDRDKVKLKKTSKK